MKQLSTLTKFYLLLIILPGFYIFGKNIPGIQGIDLYGLAILAILGGVLHILKVEGPTNRSHYTISFIIFGFTIALLGSPAILVVILVANLFQWVLNPPPAWYIQPFNIGCYIITAQFSSFIYKTINPSGNLVSSTTIIAIIASMAVFTILNHLIVGLILWLARGENFKKSGVFGITTLLIDLTMLSLGASLAIVWSYNPYALLLFLIPLYPFYLKVRQDIDRKSVV